MQSLISIVAFCVYLGIMILSILLIIYRILSWIKDKNQETRNMKLTILAWIAFAILLLMFSRYYVNHIANTNETKSENEAVSEKQLSSEQNGSEMLVDVLFWNSAKTLIKGLIYTAIFASVITLLLIVIFVIFHGLRTIITGKGGTQDQTYKKFADAIRQPIVILVITSGIVSLFFILPILVGEQKEGNLIEIWKDGIVRINDLIDFNLKEKQEEAQEDTQVINQENIKEDASIADQNNNKVEGLATYILLYIIVMGVGFAVVKLLYSILGRVILKEEEVDLIDKYSSPIALLSVGVAFLLALKGGKIPAESNIETIGELLKAFGTVIFIIAIVILVLEVVRLLMDIRQKLIRDEAKNLFIALVGQAALLLFVALNSIYSAVNSMFNSDEDKDLDNVLAKLRRRMVFKMEQQMDDDDKDYETSFSGFDEKVTKK